MANADAVGNRLARRVRPSNRGGDHWADTVDAGQSATGLGDRIGDLLGQCLESLIGLADLGDQVPGELLADRFDRSGRAGSYTASFGSSVRSLVTRAASATARKATVGIRTSVVQASCSIRA